MKSCYSQSQVPLHNVRKDDIDRDELSTFVRSKSLGQGEP